MAGCSSALQLFLAVTAMTAMCLDTASAVCRPEYQNLPGGITHTACKQSDPRCSINAATSGLSEAMKVQALQVHNDYRSQVAQGRLPGYLAAKNMYKMEWDDELAEIAQAFTDLCDFSKHDYRDARITSRFVSVGQNFGWAVHSDKHTFVDVKSWINDWFIEYKSSNSNAVSSFQAGPGGVVTHFTQVSWAETRYVGCGFTDYQLNGRLMSFFACNYAPSGNVVGSPVYLPGPTCSACPLGSACERNSGLCSGSGGSRPPLPSRGSPPIPPGGRSPSDPSHFQPHPKQGQPGYPLSGYPPYPPGGQRSYPSRRRPPYNTSGRAHALRVSHNGDHIDNRPARGKLPSENSVHRGDRGNPRKTAGDADNEEDNANNRIWLLAAVALVISFLSGACLGGSFAYMFKKNAPLKPAGAFEVVPASAWTSTTAVVVHRDSRRVIIGAR